MLVVAVGHVDEGVRTMDYTKVIRELCAEIERLSQELEIYKAALDPDADDVCDMSPEKRLVLQMLSEGHAQIKAAEASGLSRSTVSRMAHKYADLIEAYASRDCRACQ